MSIVLARIDDRLIHGQVMTSWLNYTGANKIIVIDDVTAKDSFLTMIIKTLVPANIVTQVTTVADSPAVIKGLQDHDKAIILAKTPEAYVRLAQNGVTLTRVNLGGMGIKPGRKTIYKNISASEAEIDQLKQLIQRGIQVEIQMVAEDPAMDFKRFI